MHVYMNVIVLFISHLHVFPDYNDMMLDGAATPDYIDEPAYVDNGHYINVPPDMLEHNTGMNEHQA